MNMRSRAPTWCALLGAASIAVAAAVTVSPTDAQSTSRTRCGALHPQSAAASTGSKRRPVGTILASISTEDEDGSSIPFGIAAGDGSVWVADVGVDMVLRIDPSTNRITDRIPVPGGPTRLAVADGSVWVVQRDLGSLARIDIATKTVVATVPVGTAVGEPAVGAGSVWALDGAGRQVVRIDPLTNTEIARIDVGGSGKVGGVLFAQGFIWAASHRDAQVARIDPATNTVTARVGLRHRAHRPRVAMDPEAFARGAIWVANTDVNTHGYHTVAAINVSTMKADPRRVPVVRSELAGLAHLGRSIWATDTSGTLWRIDAVSHKVQGSVGICAQTAYVTAYAGSVWAIDPLGSAIVRVRPLTLR